jgi:uncharacterized protein DUF4129
VIAQWTPAQVHDTVAAIAAQPAYRAERQSLLMRLVHLIVDKLNALFDAVSGSLNAKVVIGVTVVAVVLIIAARVAIDRRAAARRARAPSRTRAGEARRNAWTEARTFADAGNFTDASHSLYLAVIDALTTGGALRYHRSKTAGDYARDLRRAGSPIAADFRAFGRSFDRLVFGQSPISREDYDRLATLAERIVGTGRRPAAA